MSGQFRYHCPERDCHFNLVADYNPESLRKVADAVASHAQEKGHLEGVDARVLFEALVATAASAIGDPPTT